MMLRCLTLLLLLSVSIRAQTVSLLKTFGSIGTDFGSSVKVDSSGNSVVAGSFSGTVNFGGTTLTSAGGYDLFIAKYSTAGTLQWATNFGGAGSETVKSMALDASDNIYIGGGLFVGSLAKFSSLGVLSWTAGPTAANFSSIFVDSIGNVVVTGDVTTNAGGTVNFGNGVTITDPFGSTQAFLAKYSGAGTCLFAKAFANVGDSQFGTAVTVNRSTDTIFVAGYALSAINLGGGLLTNNAYGAFGFLGRFLTDGTYVWGRRVGTKLVTDSAGPFARVRSMAMDGNGDLILGGEFAFHTNLGGEPMDSGSHILNGTSSIYDMFVVKYSGSTGAYQWSNPILGNEYGGPTALAIDNQNSAILTGFFYGTYNFGGSQLTAAGSTPTVNSDGFVAKYSSTGAPLWSQRFGSPLNGDQGTSVAIGSGYAVVTGGFYGTATFGTQSATSAGDSDIFLMEITSGGATYYMDSSKTGTSNNTGTSPANAFTNWVALGGTDGQWTGVLKGGDTLIVKPGVGYVGNRTQGGAVPDAINMYGILGVSNNPIIFKASQTNGLVITPPLLVSGSFFTFDGRLSDTYTNLVNFDNLANEYQITNNINWWLRGVYGFGSNHQDGIHAPNAGPQMKFTWLHIDPFTFNTNNWPAGSSPNGVGSGTHGVNIVQNTGELLDGFELAYCYIEEADQCCVNILNNNNPHWQQGRIHHNVLTKQGDAGARLAGGFEVDHNIVGNPWAIHGHGNGIVQVPLFSLFHHNIIFNTLDTMMYTVGGGSNFNSTATGIKIYGNLFYTTKDWSFGATNIFTTNQLFVNHPIGGLQLLVEANANHAPNWLPQYWTNFFIGNNTWILSLGAVPTNANAGISGAISLPNRDAPGTPDTLADAGFVILTNMGCLNNLVYSVAPSSFGQSLGGFQGWIDKFNADPSTWANPALNVTSGILLDWRNTNSPNPNVGSANLVNDYNDWTADVPAVATFIYNGPNSTNNSYTAATFNTAYTTNGYIHNTGTKPSLVDTNNYDFRPRINDVAIVGKGTNLSNWALAPGGLPQYNMDLSGNTRPSIPSIGAYEPDPSLILHYTFDDLYPATGSVAIGVAPFVTDITGYGSTMQYWGFTATPTNWPQQVVYTNSRGGFNYAAQFVSNTNNLPAYGGFSIAQFGGVTNISAFSNLTAITISVWMKYFSSQGDTRDNSATIIDTCEGSPGNGVTWSLGRNSAYQTSFDLFTNLNYNTQNTLHLNFPDNESTDWHFYCATFNCSNRQMFIYMDGTNCGSRTFVGFSPALTNLIVGVPSTTGVFGGKNGWISVGCRTHVGSPNLADSDQFPNNAWMDGQVADLRVYNRDLGPGEQLALYNGGAATGGGVAPPLPGPQDPLITLNPLSVTVTAPATATFTANATSTNSLAFQWFKNGTAIAGATMTTFTTPATTTADNASTWFMQATAGGRTVQSSTAVLTVGAPGPQDPIITLNPTGQSVTAPATATFTSNASSTQSLTFQWSKNGAPIAGATQTTYTTPATTTADNGSTYFMVATAGGRTAQSATVTLTVNSPGPQDPRVTLNPVNQSVTAPATATFTCSVTSTQSLTLQWFKGGVLIAGATLTTYTTPPTVIGDNGSTFFMQATAGGRMVQSATATLTVNAPGPQDPLITQNPLSQAVITPATATFTSSATSTQSLAFQWFKNGVAVAGATQTTFTTPPTTTADNGSTWFMVATAGGRTTQSTTATLTVGTPGPQDPLITLNPLSQSVTAPAVGIFTANATSTNSLTFQWYKNGVLIAGATHTSYTTPATTTSDNGSKWHMIATAGGRTDQSADATLTVFPQGPQDPIITLNPLSQAVVAPATATFTSTASSTNTLSYQWFKNGSAIAGATTTVYITPPTTRADNGSGWFMIATANGRAVQSLTAILSVAPSGVAKVKDLRVDVAHVGP